MTTLAVLVLDVFRGKMRVGDNVSLIKLDGSIKNFRVTKIFGYFGLKREEIEEAQAGDLIAVSGMEDINVGETVTHMIIKKRYLYYVLMNQHLR